MEKLSVIIPVYNEEQRIDNNLHIVKVSIGSLGYDYEIIVVNDGSNDDTELVLNRIKDKRIIVCNKPFNQGKGSAIKTGLKIATGDYCMLLDADLQIHPSEVSTFFNQMRHWNADVVIGNKRHSYSNSEYTLMRKIVSKGYHLLVRILFGFPISDTQCGLKLFKKEAIDLVMSKHLAKRFTFDLEMLIAMRENNVRIVDAPVKVNKQINIGSASAGTIWNVLYDTLCVFYRLKKGWYKIK